MSVLVIGGTGTVGSQVVARLVERGENPLVMTRSADKAGNLPRGARGVVGDLTRPESLASAMKGVDRLVLITPVSQTEAEEGTAAVRAARQAGVRRIVFMSVHDVEKIPEAPHFKAKIDIEQAIGEAGIPSTIIMPNNFFQNDHWFKQAMLEYGVYPQPIGDVGLSRVDVRDIADAIAGAVTEPGSKHEGQRYPLAGPDPLTGAGTAAVWGRSMGRAIRYGGNDLDAWAKQAVQMLPEWMVHDFRIMYAAFQKLGLRATSADLAQQAKILGRAPRRFEDFAAETARAWADRP